MYQYSKLRIIKLTLKSLYFWVKEIVLFTDYLYWYIKKVHLQFIFSRKGMLV